MSRVVNYVIAGILIVIGFCMLLLGVVMLANVPANQTEWIITLSSVAASVLLFMGAWSNIRQEKYRKHVEMQADNAITENLIRQQAMVAVENHAPTLKSGLEKTTARVLTDATIDAPILARWQYPALEWEMLLKKLAEKTKREEMYTAVWFPVLFAILFLRLWHIGAAIGVLTGIVYVWFRAFFVKQKFGLPAGHATAEVVITDQYLRINSKYIHYVDGYYHVKDMSIENDRKMGSLLHIVIGWQTAKGYAASLDLFLPIPKDCLKQAENILKQYRLVKSV